MEEIELGSSVAAPVDVALEDAALILEQQRVITKQIVDLQSADVLVRVLLYKLGGSVSITLNDHMAVHAFEVAAGNDEDTDSFTLTLTPRGVTQ